jgi:hypothetical protein
MTKIAGSGFISRKHGSADPDPHQNVMDPEHLGFRGQSITEFKNETHKKYEYVFLASPAGYPRC